MSAPQASEKARAGPRPPAAPPTYRAPGGAAAPAGPGRRDIDVEGSLALALVVLGCAGPVVRAIVRREEFSSELTVCALLLVVALVLLLQKGGRWWLARARALPNAAGRRIASRPGRADVP